MQSRKKIGKRRELSHEGLLTLIDILPEVVGLWRRNLGWLRNDMEE